MIGGIRNTTREKREKEREGIPSRIRFITFRVWAQTPWCLFDRDRDKLCSIYAVGYHYRDYAGSSRLARARFRSVTRGASHVRAGGARMIAAEKCCEKERRETERRRPMRARPNERNLIGSSFYFVFTYLFSPPVSLTPLLSSMRAFGKLRLACRSFSADNIAPIEAGARRTSTVFPLFAILRIRDNATRRARSMRQFRETHL